MPHITPSASQVDYNIPGGKNTRGLSVLQGVRCLAPSLLDDPELHYKVCALGWCVPTHMFCYPPPALGPTGNTEKAKGPRRSIYQVQPRHPSYRPLRRQCAASSTHAPGRAPCRTRL